MKRKLKIVFYTLLAASAFCAILLIACNQLVTSNAKGLLYDNAESVPDGFHTALLLGTSPKTRASRRKNMFFEYRILATAQLYHAGKIQEILISGDDNSLDGVNEVECMKYSLMARGIPQEAIMLDGKGYRTIHSVCRAYQNYGCRKMIVISQKFHNERAIYLASHLGYHQIVGFNAESPRSSKYLMTYIRELFARVKMFIDLIYHDVYEKA